MKQILAWLLGWLALISPAASPLPSPSPSLAEYGSYRYALQTIADPARLRLFSNLSERLTSGELLVKRQCRVLVNAGFYDTANRHLGWFLSGGREISPVRINRLFDGYIFFQGGGVNIGFEKQDKADWGFQSGPMLIYDAKPLKLNIKDDQPRRRIVAGTNRENELVFLAIVSPESDYSGPLLSDLPKIVKGIDPGLTAAINLDGGSASAFINETVVLKEYQPVGGYFCYTEP